MCKIHKWLTHPEILPVHLKIVQKPRKGSSVTNLWQTMLPKTQNRHKIWYSHMHTMYNEVSMIFPHQFYNDGHDPGMSYITLIYALVWTFSNAVKMCACLLKWKFFQILICLRYFEGILSVSKSFLFLFISILNVFYLQIHAKPIMSGTVKRYPIKEISQCLLHINLTSHHTQAVSKNRCIFYRPGCHAFRRALKGLSWRAMPIMLNFKKWTKFNFRTFHC